MANIIVQKYGGTSVGTTDKIKNVANRIKTYHNAGNQVVVVVSAMGHTTDELLELAERVNPNPSRREMDMLLSTGEQISVSLLAMALEAIEVPAQSFTGSQVKIMTDGNFSNAKIQGMDDSRIRKALDSGKVVIVAGFQGIDPDENITTLGRGGSDTTAVAIAAALKAEECEIYTDVDGVFTADPNKVPGARMHERICYDEMLELASLGAGVLHSRSVELAKNYDVVIHVRSSFHMNPGTLVVSEEKLLEQIRVSGVTIKKEEARVTILDVPDKPGIAADLFGALAEADIIVDVIVQSSPHNGKNTISFTIPRKSIRGANAIFEGFCKKHGTGSVDINDKIAIISAVGVGMKSHVGVASKMFKALAENNINIEMITTSEIKISCVIPEEQGQTALKAIHGAFL
jgi:aspartate kinase